MGGLKVFCTLILSAFLLAPALASLPDSIATSLKQSGKLEIQYDECSSVESKVGQLMYINVDGFGSDYAIHPYYNKLVKRIQPGGVLPHFNKHDAHSMHEATKKLQEASHMPLMIGIDYEKVYLDNPDDSAKIGLGFGTGLIGELESKDTQCYKHIGLIDAALHRAIGLNHSLGPTVEHRKNGILENNDEMAKRATALTNAFRSMQVETTIKHYPYTPEDYNLHTKSEDTKIPADEIQNRYLPAFSSLKNQSGFLMTTHLYNSNIDPDNMATFSNKWMKLLRNEVGFGGIVMTDALFMIDSYSDNMKAMTRNWNDKPDISSRDEMSIFAAKAILAGHDMVFLESSALKTEIIFQDLVTLSCQNNTFGKKLRYRINESYKRIKKYKDDHAKSLRSSVNLDAKELRALLEAKNNIDKTCTEGTVKYNEIFKKLEGSLVQTEAHYCWECWEDFQTNVDGDKLQSLVDVLKEANGKYTADQYIRALLSNNTDLFYFALNGLETNKVARAQVLNKAGFMLKSKNQDDRLRALRVFKALDDWPAPALDAIISSNDSLLFDTFLKESKYADLPTPYIPLKKALAVAKRSATRGSAQRKQEIDRVLESKFFTDEYVASKGGEIWQAVQIGDINESPITRVLKMYFPAAKTSTNEGAAEVMSLPLQFEYKLNLLTSTGAVGTEPDSPRPTASVLVELIRKNNELAAESEPVRYSVKYDSSEVHRDSMEIMSNSIQYFSEYSPEDQKKIRHEMAKLKSSPNWKTKYYSHMALFDMNKTASNVNEFASAIETIDNCLQKNCGLSFDYDSDSYDVLNRISNFMSISERENFFAITDESKHKMIRILKNFADNTNDKEYFKEKLQEASEKFSAKPQ